MLDTVHAHVVALKGELNVPVNRPRLVKPQLAPPELACSVQEAAACDEEVTCSDSFTDLYAVLYTAASSRKVRDEFQ